MAGQKRSAIFLGSMFHFNSLCGILSIFVLCFCVIGKRQEIVNGSAVAPIFLEYAIVVDYDIRFNEVVFNAIHSWNCMCSVDENTLARTAFA